MKTIVYLHSSKENMYDKGTELGLKGEALEIFKYALGEVEIGIDINEDTGEAKIISVDKHIVVQ